MLRARQRCGRRVPPAALSLLAMLVLAHPAVSADSASTAGAANGTRVGAAAAPRGCLPSHDGYLRARLRGASNLDIGWSDAQLQCDGGRRATGKGILLTFAGRTREGGHRVRFVFGIDAAAAPGVTRERAANVTVIFEGERRLYSTRGDSRCTVDLLRQTPLGGSAGARALRVQARGFCIAPAIALDGQGELLLSRFDFVGLIRLGT